MVVPLVLIGWLLVTLVIDILGTKCYKEWGSSK